MLKEKELEIVNEIIEMIYTTSNIKELRIQFLKKLALLIPFVFADFNIGLINLDHSPKLIDPVIVSKFDENFEKRFIHLYETKFYKMDYVNWVFMTPDSLVYRESDLINEKIKKKSRFYQEYLQEFGLIYVAGIVIANNSKLLGAVSLYKSEQGGDFSEKDLSILNLFVSHLKRRFESEDLKNNRKITTSSIKLKYEYQLTKREIEIMGLILYGYSNLEIEQRLKISVNTVKKHISNIFLKLGISGRPQLVRFIIKRDFISLWNPDDY